MMIRLTRGQPPIQLTPLEAARLTAIYEASGKPVWNRGYIQTALLAMSYNKCAYCEAYVNEKSSYMEVEHYHCKDKHPNRVVDWSNLLPACKRCNGSKLAYDVVTEGELVDPTVDDPRQHFVIKNYRLYGRDGKGKRTVEELDLNESDRLGTIRFNVANKVGELLDKLEADLQAYKKVGTADPGIGRKLVRNFRRLLKEAQPDAEFSAATATVIKQHHHYPTIRSELTGLGLWQSDFDSLEQAISKAFLG